MRAYVAEFIGTFALVFAGVGAIAADYATDGAVGLVGIAFAHGLAIALMIAALGAVSGAHFNPAVTFGLWSIDKIDLGTAVGYWAAQLLGGLVAAGLLGALYGADLLGAVAYGAPALAEGVSLGAGIAIEAVLTFFLVFVIATVAVYQKSALAPFAIGLAIVMDIFAGGPLTGAAMNPARAFGPALLSGAWAGHLAYWVGPLVGGVLAALAARWFYEK